MLHFLILIFIQSNTQLCHISWGSPFRALRLLEKIIQNNVLLEGCYYFHGLYLSNLSVNFSYITKLPPVYALFAKKNYDKKVGIHPTSNDVVLINVRWTSLFLEETHNLKQFVNATNFLFISAMNNKNVTFFYISWNNYR